MPIAEVRNSRASESVQHREQQLVQYIACWRERFASESKEERAMEDYYTTSKSNGDARRESWTGNSTLATLLYDFHISYNEWIECCVKHADLALPVTKHSWLEGWKVKGVNGLWRASGIWLVNYNVLTWKKSSSAAKRLLRGLTPAVCGDTRVPHVPFVYFLELFLLSFGLEDTMQVSELDLAMEL